MNRNGGSRHSFAVAIDLTTVISRWVLLYFSRHRALSSLCIENTRKCSVYLRYGTHINARSRVRERAKIVLLHWAVKHFTNLKKPNVKSVTNASTCRDSTKHPLSFLNPSNWPRLLTSVYLPILPPRSSSLNRYQLLKHFPLLLYLQCSPWLQSDLQRPSELPWRPLAFSLNGYGKNRFDPAIASVDWRTTSASLTFSSLHIFSASAYTEATDFSATSWRMLASFGYP